MYVYLKNILQLFSKHGTKIVESGDDVYLTTWSVLEHSQHSYDAHTLYVCSYSVLSQIGGQVNDGHFLCPVQSSEHGEMYLDFLPSSSSVLFVEGLQVDEAVAVLKEYFETQYKYALFSAEMLDILSADGGIQQMVNRAYVTLKNPICVFDNSFRLIAANWNEMKEVDTNIVENSGFSNREFEMLNSRDHIHRRVQRSEVPIRSYNHAISCEQLLCAITTEKDLGHIVVTAVNHPFIPSDELLLQILKRSIAELFKKDEFIRNMHGFHYEPFLRDLLDGKIATKQAFLDRLNYVCRDFRGNLYCLVVEMARSSGIVNTTHIRTRVESLAPNIKTLLYNGQIIGIPIFPESVWMADKMKADVAQLSQEEGIYVGLSNCFRSILDLPAYYNQALRAIELGVCHTDQAGLFSYEQYYLEHIKNVFLQIESAETFCHPKMKRLLEYDRTHDSELAYTLYSYLSNERSLAKTALKMNMHRNSVVYRIKKIHSLIGEEFGGYMERQYLILSYEINSKQGDR